LLGGHNVRRATISVAAGREALMERKLAGSLVAVASVERRTDGETIVQGNELAEVAVVADIWKNILRVDAVGREDNFFEMGGSSLHAMLLASRVLKATGVELSLSIFFDDPTFGALSKAVSADLAQRT
jgi:aryl carrier-like protein